MNVVELLLNNPDFITYDIQERFDNLDKTLSMLRIDNSDLRKALREAIKFYYCGFGSLWMVTENRNDNESFQIFYEHEGVLRSEWIKCGAPDSIGIYRTFKVHYYYDTSWGRLIPTVTNYVYRFYPKGFSDYESVQKLERHLLKLQKRREELLFVY